MEKGGYSGSLWVLFTVPHTQHEQALSHLQPLSPNHLGQLKGEHGVAGVTQTALAPRPQDHWQAQSVGSCTV